jgi:MYXO-CTERM domain-containing protein
VSGACVAEEIPSDLPPDENPDGIHDADSGCGCVVAGRDADGLPALLLLASLFGLLVLARRRNV